MLPRKGLLETSWTLADVGVGAAADDVRSSVAIGLVEGSGLEMGSIFALAVWGPADCGLELRLPELGAKAEMGATCEGAVAAGALLAGDAIARGAADEALLRDPAPLAAPLSSCSSGRRR